jgi:hypothetical protein
MTHPIVSNVATQTQHHHEPPASSVHNRIPSKHQDSYQRSPARVCARAELACVVIDAELRDQRPASSHGLQAKLSELK